MNMRFIASLCALFLAAAPATAQQAPPPVEAYGRLPAVGDVAISPDGHHIILQQADGDATAFRIINLDTQQSVYSARIESPTTLRGVGWADNEHAVIYVTATVNTGSMGVYVRGQTRATYGRVGVYSLRTNHMTFMLEDIEDAHVNTGLTSLRAPIEGDPGYGRMTAYQREGSTYRLVVYRVNLDTGRARVAARGDGSKAESYLLDRSGAIVARTDADEDTNRWQIYGYAGGSPHLLMEGTEETGSSPYLYGLTSAGRLVAYAPDDDNAWRMVSIDTGSGAAEELTPDIPENNCARVDRWTGLVVGYCWDEDFTKFHYYDADLAAVQTSLDGFFSDGFGEIVDWSQDRSRYVVYGETAQDAGAYYVYEPANNNILQVGMRYPELVGANFGIRQEIRYPARDGTPIPAYLHLPRQGARNLPLVVYVHGGPHSRDTFEFNYRAAFFVSRGYAVLQPNFRGSSGFGRAWMDAGRGNWGDGVMQTDVIDGVDALVRQGIVDPRRVCIVGASYGGYAALAGATLTPDKFACAISISGVSDLLLMLDNASAGNSRSGGAEWWRLSIGDRRADRDHLRAISPAYQAGRAQSPILMLHGTNDTTVPIEQSRRMNEALRSAGRQVQFVELPGEDHYMSSQASRQRVLREIDSFLAQNLGPGAQ